MLAQLHRLFHHVQPFVNNLEGCPATRANLLCVFQNSKDFEQLHLQLAITIDTGKVFVMKTYILEGDGELIVEAYSHLHKKWPQPQHWSSNQSHLTQSES